MRFTASQYIWLAVFVMFGAQPSGVAAPGETSLEGVSAPVATVLSATNTLSLATAQQLAFERNWDLLAAKMDVDLATAQKIVARQFPNPTLALSSAKINVDDHPISTGGRNDYWSRNYDTIFAINQLFEIGGKRASRKASAESGIKAAEARLADARRVLNVGMAKTYLAAVLAGNQARILRESADSLRQEARIAQIRLRAGDISTADKDQIELGAERLELDAKAAEANAVSARIAVEVLLGAKSAQGQWTPADALEALVNDVPPANVSPLAGNRPDLLAAEADRAKADAELRLQRAQRMPDPTVFFQYEHEPADQPNTIGLGVSFPLPLWNRNKGAINAAQTARDQAALQAEKLKAQIAAEVTIARLNHDEASARWKRYRDELQPKSAEIRKTVSFAYQKGGASLLDLLSALRNDNEIRLATAQAATDAAAAAAALKAALNYTDILQKSP